MQDVAPHMTYYFTLTANNTHGALQ